MLSPSKPCSMSCGALDNLQVYLSTPKFSTPLLPVMKRKAFKIQMWHKECMSGQFCVYAT